jgi:hypothetical protein
LIRSILISAVLFAQGPEPTPQIKVLEIEDTISRKVIVQVNGKDYLVRTSVPVLPGADVDPPPPPVPPGDTNPPTAPEPALGTLERGVRDAVRQISEADRGIRFDLSSTYRVVARWYETESLPDKPGEVGAVLKDYMVATLGAEYREKYKHVHNAIVNAIEAEYISSGVKSRKEVSHIYRRVARALEAPDL